MKLESKFDKGDQVFYVLEKNTPIYEYCFLCKGTGKINSEVEIEGHKYQRINCPECAIRGDNKEVVGNENETIVVKLTVDNIFYNLHNKGEFSYQCCETGGQSYRENDLYKTEEAAKEKALELKELRKHFMNV